MLALVDPGPDVRGHFLLVDEVAEEPRALAVAEDTREEVVGEVVRIPAGHHVIAGGHRRLLGGELDREPPLAGRRILGLEHGHRRGLAGDVAERLPDQRLAAAGSKSPARQSTALLGA